MSDTGHHHSKEHEPRGGHGSQRYAVSTEAAPKAIGPYSQAMRAGDFLFCSGQIPLDPATGKLVGGDVRAQITQVLKNLSAVLAAEGLSFSDLVKTTIFVKNIEDFKTVNEAYGQAVKPPYPARATVEVARLPLDALVEIEAVACYPKQR